MTAAAPPAELADQVVSLIRAHRFRYQDEAQLQGAIEAVLTTAGIEVAAEVTLAGRDRIDLLTGQVGIEVKVAGRLADVVRQLRRYAASPEVSALILVTNRARHRAVPAELGGKPVQVVWLSGVTG